MLPDDLSSRAEGPHQNCRRGASSARAGHQVEIQASSIRLFTASVSRDSSRFTEQRKRHASHVGGRQHSSMNAGAADMPTEVENSPAMLSLPVACGHVKNPVPALRDRSPSLLKVDAKHAREKTMVSSRSSLWVP